MSPQKRKRESQDMPDMRAPPGLSQDTSEFEQQYLHHAEDDDNHIDFSSFPGQSTHNESALIDEQPPPQPQQQLQQPDQQTSNHQTSHQHNQAVIPSASDTATAALAQYHTMSVPQPTENTFMHQPTEGGDRISATPADQTPGVQRSGSFGDMEGAGPNGNASSPTGTQATPGGSKPSVGSEEWHKVRRDNHKEGEKDHF
jgi:bHLH factor